MVAFPESLDAFTNPDALSHLDSPGHHLQHGGANDAIEQLERLLVGPVFVSVDAYFDTPAVQLHSADVLSDSSGAWTAVGVYSAGSNPGPAVDTVNFTEGTGSVEAYLTSPANNTTNRLSFTLNTAVAVGVHTDVTIEVAVNNRAGTTTQRNRWSVVIADGVDLTGNTSTVAVTTTNIPTEDGTFYSFRVPVGSLASVKSFGVKKTTSTGGSSDHLRWSLDDVRLSATTPFDQAAVATATGGTIVVPAHHSTTIDQTPRALAASQGYLDLRRSHAVLAGAGGVKNVREWNVDETGETDASAKIQEIIDSLSDGDTLVFPPTGIFRFDNVIGVRNSLKNVTIDGQGCRVFLTEERDTPIFSLTGLTSCTLRGFREFGYSFIVDDDIGNGHGGPAHMATVAGSPVVSGATMTLDGQNDEARIPKKNIGAGFTASYARDYLYRNRVDFTLSDTAQVANDCAIQFSTIDGDVLQTTTYTLTSTPTVYTTYFTPTDIFAPLVISVKKMTATTNTITISSYTEYGKQRYDANLALAHGVRVSGGSGCVIEDMWIEGATGDAFALYDVTASGHTIRRVVGRVTGRHGFGLVNGYGHSIQDAVVIAPGQWGVDVEPETLDVEIADVRVDGLYIVNPSLGYWDSQAWSRARNFHLKNVVCVSYEIGRTMFNGGFWGGTIDNLYVLRVPSSGTAAGAVIFQGENVAISNVVAMGGIHLDNDTDMPTSGVLQTTDHISVRNWRALNPDAADFVTNELTHANIRDVYILGQDTSLGTNYAGLNQTVGNGASSQAVTFAYTEFDANYAVFLSPSWLTTWRVTSLATTGFTAEFGTAAGSSDTFDWRIERTW